MKQGLTLFIGLCLVSCSNTSDIELDEEKTEDFASLTITSFSCHTAYISDSTLLTRAAEAEMLSNLLIVDVVDGKCVQTVTRVNMPQSQTLDSVKMLLSSGTHDIYFLHSTTPWHNFDEKALLVNWDESTAPLGDVQVSHQTFQVEANDKIYSEISLSRAVSLFLVVITDPVPADVTLLRHTVEGGSWTYNLNKMAGDIPTTINKNVELISYAENQTDLQTGIYTFVPSGTPDFEYSLSSFDASSNLFSSYSNFFTGDITEKNKVAWYTGTFFSGNASFTIKLQTDWDGIYEYTF